MLGTAIDQIKIGIGHGADSSMRVGILVINHHGPGLLTRREGGTRTPLSRWAGVPVSPGPINPVCEPNHGSICNSDFDF